MTIQFALDLELEQNGRDNPIIQIGACTFSKDGVIDTFSRFIKIDEPLSEYIVDLTGITDADLNGGVTLQEAYNDLVEFTKNCHSKQAVVWGDGDMHTLRKQLGPDVKWEYGYRTMDVKTLHTFISSAKNMSKRGGLGATLKKWGLEFLGSAHNATDDSINTALLYNRLKKEIK